jgi:arginyl-tRNA synthetase
LTDTADWLRDALQEVARSLGHADAEILVERPRDPSHGDFATNIALQLAQPLQRNPRELARAVLSQLDLPAELVERTEIAGPGFINFWLAKSAVGSVLRTALARGTAYGRSDVGNGRRVNVEFVSANPTGPLHVGHGRGAALGDAIASLLEATGHAVTREFYVNDAGLQVERLAQSLWARVQQAAGQPAEIPEGGYHGAYLQDLAAKILAEHGSEVVALPAEDGIARCREIGVRSQREEQDRDLADFGVRFDVSSSERQLYEGDALRETLQALEQGGHIYERDGALWLRTTQFGDTKDRVLRKSDGSYTYFLPDIAYHRNKWQRGFSEAIDVWGADHHGYVPRMQSALRALGAPEAFFKAVIVQLVRVVRHGAEVRFSKRSGEFVTLRDLYEETGVDAARYFFLMRRGEAQFVFDIDLATKQSEENPVYYVQYAHTRMAGIFRTGSIDPALMSADGVDVTLLNEGVEQELIRRLAEYPAVVCKAAEALEPHRVVGFLEDVARLVNGWYHHHRVLGVGPELERARLVLARASQIVLANGLNLLGVTAPERM